MTVASHHAILEAQYQDLSQQDIANHSAKGIPYYTPAQEPPAGTASDPQPNGQPIPKLFRPLKIRGTTFQNRIFLSPLCQYSADDGHHTAWHLTHLGGIAQRGPGLTMVEATAVTPQGRITPEDSGLWQDSQMAGLKNIVDFAHSQNQKIGIQLAHAGRKASTVAPWLSTGAVATEKVGGWPNDVWGPSAVPWNEKHAPVKAYTKQDIEELKQAFAAAIDRAVKIGFDVIEIHNAHGYLLHSWVSPIANKRTDEYGGSYENRTRLTKEIVQLARARIPADMPLFLRISGTDYLEEALPDEPSWRVADTARLAPELAALGVDLLDVSGGGNHPAQHPHVGPGYQVPSAVAAKKAVGDAMLVTTVGAITEGKQANAILESDGLDAVFVGRFFQKNPGLVWSFAEDLNTEINMANQIRWGFGGRGGMAKKK